MQKIKYFIENDKGKDVLTILVVILVGLGSFGLGRLSKNSSLGGIKIEYSNQNANSNLSLINTDQNVSNLPNKDVVVSQTTIGSTNPSGREFFASKIGSKYYSIGCSGGKTIKQENKIYFTTEAEAIGAGYEKSASCK